MSKSNEMINTTDPESAAKMEKLRLEVAELQWKVKWAYKIGQFISVVTAAIAVSAFLVSLYQISAEQRRSAERNAEAKEAEAKAREKEFRKPVWEKQLALLFEVSDAAAKIATSSPEDEERKRAEARFRQLYWGPVVLAENEILKEEMIKFKNCLDGISDDCNSEEKKSDRLRDLSIILTNKCRAAIATTWDISLVNLYERKEEEVKGTPTPLP